MHVNTLWLHRKRLKIGQKTLANRLNVKTQQVSKWERGALPSLENAIKLSLILGVPMESLFSGLYGVLRGRRPTLTLSLVPFHRGYAYALFQDENVIKYGVSKKNLLKEYKPDKVVTPSKGNMAEIAERYGLYLPKKNRLLWEYKDFYWSKILQALTT